MLEIDFEFRPIYRIQKNIIKSVGVKKVNYLDVDLIWFIGFKKNSSNWWESNLAELGLCEFGSRTHGRWMKSLGHSVLTYVNLLVS